MQHPNARVVFVSLGLALLGGCGDSQTDAGEQAQIEKGAACSEVASSCPTGCYESRAIRYDSERNCRSRTTDEVVGCRREAEVSDDSICATSPHGTFLGSSSILVPPTYTRCDDELTHVVKSAATCD